MDRRKHRSTPADMVRERVVYRVRVPVVFDPPNDELRTRINRGQAELMQVLGAHAAIRGDDLELGRFELCLELAGDPVAEGSRQAAEEAVRLVKVALRRLEVRSDRGRTRTAYRRHATGGHGPPVWPDFRPGLTQRRSASDQGARRHFEPFVHLLDSTARPPGSPGAGFYLKRSEHSWGVVDDDDLPDGRTTSGHDRRRSASDGHASSTSSIGPPRTPPTNHVWVQDLEPDHE